MTAIRTYVRKSLRADLVAGLTVAVMGVPQAMAYAMIAKLPPAFGLYTAIVTCVVAALLGSSSHLVTGPTNALCLVLIGLIGPITEGGRYDPIEVVLLLTFMTGTIQLAFGILRLGGIIRYVSNSVVIGFSVGAGVLIGANQLKNILGVEIAAGGRRFHDVLIATAQSLPETNFYALAIGLVTAAVTVLMGKIDRRIPASLLGVVSAGLLAYYAGWSEAGMGAHRVEIVGDVQPISGNLLAMFRMPAFVTAFDMRLAGDLLTGATALALIGFLEAASIARATAAQSGQRLDFNREFIGQGASKMVGAFTSCFVSSGSITRTSVSFHAGGQTRMAAVFSAVWTAFTVVLLAPVANHIPKPALAGLLLVVAAGMIDRRRLKITWRSGLSSRVVLSGTLAATLILPLQYAIFIGFVLSIIMLLRVTGRMHLSHLIPHPDHGFEEVPFTRAAASPVVAINLEGALYFAAADDLDYELLRCLHPVTRVVVLRVKRLRAAGSTAMAMLEHYEELLRSRGIQLVVCGVEEELERLIIGSGMRERIGVRNIFRADNHLLRSTELAHARAWSIVESERPEPAPPGRDPQVAAAAEPPAGPGIKELMSRQCIRFGNRHPLREALWLMSEMNKESSSAVPLPLFLQDREGRLYGELSIWAILAGATRGKGALADLDETELRDRIRERFEQPIDSLARKDLPRIDAETRLEDALRTSSTSEVSVLPVRDANERLVGILDPVDLLRGVARLLDLPCDGRADTHEGSRVQVCDAAGIADAFALILMRPAERAPRTLIVHDDQGLYRGIVTPAAAVKAIVARAGDRPLALARDSIRAMTVKDLMLTDAPTASPTSPIAELLSLLLERSLEAVPIVTGGRAVGLMTIIDVFRVASDLALNPEDRGIDAHRKD